MRRIICVILSMTLIFSLFHTVNAVQASSNPDNQEIFCIDFDDLAIAEETDDQAAFRAAYPSAKFVSNGIWKYAVSEHTSEPGDKYLYIRSTNQTDVCTALQLEFVNPPFAKNTGKYIFSYDINFKGSTANGPFFRVKTFHYPPNGIDNWGPVFQAMYPQNGQIKATYSTATAVENNWSVDAKDTVNAVTFDTNTWHKAEARIDTNVGKIDYYYDGNYVGTQSGATFLSSNVSGAKYFQLGVFQGYDSYEGVYLDNIKIEKEVPYVEKVEIVDVAGKKTECASTVNAVSKKIEIKTENTASMADLGAVSLTSTDGTVYYSVLFDATTQICTVEATSYFTVGNTYTLSILGKTYSFTVGGAYAITELCLKEGDAVVEDISTVSAGDTISANVTIVKTTNQPQDVVLAVACYDGNNMKSFIYKNVSAPAELPATSDGFDITVPECDNLVIKAFVIDNLTDNNPLKECVVVGTNTDTEKFFTVTETDTSIANKNVTIMVYAPDKGNTDLAELTEMADVLAYYDSVVADDGGSYSVDVRLTSDSVSGSYKAFASRGGATVALNQKLFVSATDNRTEVGNLLLETTKNGFLSYAKEHSADLGFGEFASTVPDEAYEILYTYYSSNTVDPTDYATNISVARQCERLAVLNTDKTDNNIFASDSDFSTVFPDAFDDVSELFENSYFTEDFQKRVTADVKGVMDLSAIRATIKEQFLLNLVENSNGFTNLTPALKKFASELGVTKESEITDAVSKKLSGKQYETIRELANAIDDILNPEKPQKPSKPSYSSGGGGGGGGGGIGIIATGLPSVAKDKDKEVTSSKTPEIPKNIYTDISDEHWAKDAIVELTVKGIMSGNGDGKFRPGDNVTREQFTKMIVAAFCEDVVAEDISFVDVEKDKWYYEYIAVAYKEGLISGISDKTFGAGENITRQDMAVILNRAAQKYNYNFDVPEIFESFDDDADISDYARESVYTLKNAGVLNGNGIGFSPKAFATRAEAAMIIYNMISM